MNRAMDLSIMIADFIELIQDDPRISPAHVSLFLAIINTYEKQKGKMPVTIFKKHITKQAKISPSTFHRCINDLNNFRYIRYIPSYSSVKGSYVYISKLSS
jgi:hypothetical protein